MSNTDSAMIVWFRQDLRLADHPALSAAVTSGRPIVPVFVLDAAAGGRWTPGGASRWWLHHSLAALSRDLETAGARLVLRRGRTGDVLRALARETGATEIHASARTEPWARNEQDEVAGLLQRDGIAVTFHAGALLHDPDAVRTGEGGPYKVFTPFWGRLQDAVSPAPPRPAPKRLSPPSQQPRSEALDAWRLTPSQPDWAGGWREVWSPGERGARARLQAFLAGPVERYAEARDFPGIDATSRLSPHLHFGEISPATCWHAALAVADKRSTAAGGATAFRRELAWRDFSYHLLHHWPDLPEAPFKPEFARFAWRTDRPALTAWQRGMTGYPIVDAGMRELWHTGIMHNRVRMIVASFLIKDLLIPWQEGEAWFWDTLVDADLASNAASWQWVAGSGADAAPYFRIFNPVKQGEKFDPDGRYVRQWVPELRELATPALHAPWEASEGELRMAGVGLGTTYPRPIVDHGEARGRALDAYALVKAGKSAG